MWDVSIERTPSSLQIVRLGGGPFRIWTATQGRDLGIEPSARRRTPEEAEPITLPLFDTRPWESHETGWG